MRKWLLFLLLVIGGSATAQLRINGHQALWIEATSTFYVTVPEQFFGTDATMTIDFDGTYQQCLINGTILNKGDSYTFPYLSNNNSFQIVLNGKTSTSRFATLRFTFLPIVQLVGEFGYNYAEGKVLLLLPDATAPDTLPASLKWRGGSTNAANKHKRNYHVKLKKNMSLFGMRNDDSWILDAGQADVFRLRNRIAWDIWRDLAHPPYYIDKEPAARNSIEGKVVELFLNEDYRGIYHLSENIDRKQMRLKQVKDGEVRGCLYKVKDYGYGNMNDTVAPYDNTSVMWEKIEAKYPDLQDNDTTDWSTLYNAFNFVTFSTDKEFEEHVEEYFDLPVLADYCIFVTVLGALDNRGKNTFWAVYDKTKDKKLTPVPWDLDCTIGQEWAGSISIPNLLVDLGIGLTNRLNEHNICHFNDTLNNRYKELRQSLFSTDSLISRYVAYYEMVKNSGAAAREAARWSGDSDVRGSTINFDKEIDYIKKWILIHLNLLDQAYFPVHKWYEWIQGINDTSVAPRKPAEGLYTIDGRRVDDTCPPKPGIYIRNGRKVIIR